MSDNVVSHPHRDLMAEAKREREVADSAEGQVLQQAICKAVNAYSEFLEREGVIWEFVVDPADPNWPRMKAQALVITLDYGRCRGIEIQLKDGALDRVFTRSSRTSVLTATSGSPRCAEHRTCKRSGKTDADDPQLTSQRASSRGRSARPCHNVGKVVQTGRSRACRNQCSENSLRGWA
jgi:hypothetical protein